MRGLSFDYPEQVSSVLPTATEYPYCIQALGKDVYAVNVGLRRAAYNGLDLCLLINVTIIMSIIWQDMFL